jgi:hypothetical protein
MISQVYQPYLLALTSWHAYKLVLVKNNGKFALPIKSFSYFVGIESNSLINTI